MSHTASAWPHGSGEMAERIRAHDWASTPLGAKEGWPGALRTAVDLVLACPVAAIVLWGPEHFQIYNDLWVTVHPRKHPDALGQRTHETFPQLVDLLEPTYRRALAGEGVLLGETLLPVVRKGSLVDAWWNVTYTPLRGASGTVDGIFCTFMETTTEVLTARALRESEERQAFLLRLSDALRPLSRADEVPTAAARVIGETLGVDRAYFGDMRQSEQRGFIFQEYKSVTDRERTLEMLRQNEERQAFLLKLSDALRPLADPVRIQEAAARLTGEYLQTNRVAYAETFGDCFEIKASWERDIPSMVGRFDVKAYGEYLLAGFHAGRTMISTDAAHDPEITKAERIALAQAQVGSYIGVPLVKDGRWAATFAIHNREPRQWTQTEIRLVQDVAERTWAAMERARAEATLRESEEKYRTLFENLGQGYAECELIRGPDGHATDLRYLALNPALERLSGLRVEETLGRTAREAVPGIEESQFEMYDQIVEGGVPARREYYIATLGRWYENHIYPSTGDRFFALYEDISERKRAETALRESEERFRLFVENVREYALVQTDFEGLVTGWNPGAERLFGYSSAEIVGKPFVLLLPEEDRHDGIIAREMAKLSRGEKNVDAHTLQRKDGTQFWVEWVTEPVLDDAGTLRGTAKVMRDETDRQQAEHAVRSSLAEKEELLKEVHHRVKNNLQVITSLLNLQVGTVKDRGTLAKFEEARNRVQSISDIHEMLYKSASFASIRLSSYAEQLLPRLVRFYGMERRVEAKVNRSEAVIEMERAVPFGLVLNELVSNALKHGFPDGRRGQVQVDVQQEGEEIVLRVSDTGVGLPAGLDYEQSSSLGLKLVRVLMRQLRGTIETVPGDGAVFEARFPAKDRGKQPSSALQPTAP